MDVCSAKAGLEFRSTPLNLKLGVGLGFGGVGLLSVAEGLAPRSEAGLFALFFYLRYPVVGLGLLAMAAGIVCLSRTRIVVRREEKDLLRVGALGTKVLARKGEPRRLWLESEGPLTRLSVEVAGGEVIVLAQTPDSLMVETVAQEVAGILSVDLQDLRLAPPSLIRYAESEGELPFYMQDPDGASPVAVGVRVQREPGSCRLEVRSSAQVDPDLLTGFLVFSSFPLLIVSFYAYLMEAGGPGPTPISSPFSSPSCTGASWSPSR